MYFRQSLAELKTVVPCSIDRRSQAVRIFGSVRDCPTYFAFNPSRHFAMHELSIALSIVEVASQEAARLSERTVGVHLQLGALAGVEKESLLLAWELARRDSPLAQADLIIEEIAATAYCARCEGEREVMAPQLFLCANCGQPLQEVIRGRELEIAALEVDA